MAQFATGNFTAPDGTALQVADPNFTVSVGGATIQTNRVMPNSSGGVLARHSGVPASADYAVEASLYRAASGAGNLGIMLRMHPTQTTGYYGRYDVTSAGWQGFRVTNGGFTQLGSTVPDTFSVGETKGIRLEAIGNSIRVYANGATSPTIQATDGNITAAGQAGMRCGATAPNIHIASFLAYDPFSAFLAYRSAQSSSNMRKNQANQVVPFLLITSAGAAVTSGTTTVYVTGDNGVQTAGLGTVAHKGNGQWNYVPTQAETNFDHVDFLPVNALAIPCPPVSYDTISYNPHDTAGLGLSRLDAAVSGALQATAYTAPDSAATIAAAVWGAATRTLTTVADSAGITTLLSRITGTVLLAADYTTPPTATENADALLKRDWTAVSGEAARSALNALRLLRNKWSTASGELVVTKEDDATTAWSSTLTSDAAANPVTGSDPS